MTEDTQAGASAARADLICQLAAVVNAAGRTADMNALRAIVRAGWQPPAEEPVQAEGAPSEAVLRLPVRLADGRLGTIIDAGGAFIARAAGRELGRAIVDSLNLERQTREYEPIASRDVPDELVAMLSGDTLDEHGARLVLAPLLTAYRRILFADVPDELVDAIATVLNDDAHEGCGDEPCPGNVLPYFEDLARVALAEGLRQRDRRVRAETGAELAATFQRMRESGDQDMRTAIDYVVDATGCERP